MAAMTELRMVAWELTRSCNLACGHCRASSGKGPYDGELGTAECFAVLDDIASFAKPVIILTGGEPLLRKDVFEIAGYGRSKGLRIVMATNGTLLDGENIPKITGSGIKTISVSLDGPDGKSHDALRRVPGAFESALAGIEKAKAAGLGVQVNSTITKKNIGSLPEIMNLGVKLGVKSHHLFLLVPAGRGRLMEAEELSPAEYERTLQFLSLQKRDSRIDIKVTCAPHFNRILLQAKIDKTAHLGGTGCMAGSSFCFISHLGELQPCGYFEIACGNVRRDGFRAAWTGSEVFNSLRDRAGLKGKCGACEFKTVCGGCRARAYAKNGDYLSPEPYCIYEPRDK